MATTEQPDDENILGIFDKGPDESASPFDLTMNYFKEANASLALEGQIVPPESIEIQKRVAAGEITHDEAVALITAKYTTKH